MSEEIDDEAENRLHAQNALMLYLLGLMPEQVFFLMRKQGLYGPCSFFFL